MWTSTWSQLSTRRRPRLPSSSLIVIVSFRQAHGVQLPSAIIELTRASAICIIRFRAGPRNRGTSPLVSGARARARLRLFATSRKFTHLHTRAIGLSAWFAGIHEPAILSTNTARRSDTYLMPVVCARESLRTPRVRAYVSACVCAMQTWFCASNTGRAVCTADGSIRDITATSNKLPIPDSSPSIHRRSTSR